MGIRTAQPIAVASITSATITPTAAGADVEYRLSIPTGISLIHVPLKVTAVDGVAKTIESVADLYDALGGTNAVNFLITYDSQAQEWRSYFVALDKGTVADAILTDDKGVIAGMRSPVSIQLRGSALGTNGNGNITLNPGLNLVGLPLNDLDLTRVSDLLVLDGIRDNVPVIILTDRRGVQAGWTGGRSWKYKSHRRTNPLS